MLLRLLLLALVLFAALLLLLRRALLVLLVLLLFCRLLAIGVLVGLLLVGHSGSPESGITASVSLPCQVKAARPWGL